MPKAEIAFRLAQRRLEKKEQRRHASGEDRLSDADFVSRCCGLSSQENAADRLFQNFLSGNRDRFFPEAYVKADRIKKISEHLNTGSWLKAADHLCGNKVWLLGHEFDLAQSGEWHKDPFEDLEWPRLFYSLVSKSKPSETVDIKYIWEMNRHQYLIVLAKAYWISGDEKYAKKVVEIISSWIADNPYHTGVNWTSSLELAVRALAWIWAYFLCLGSKYFNASFHFLFLKSIYEHGLHMADHLSTYSSPYNHLIGEAAGLHVIGSLFSQLKAAPAWEDLGWSLLERNIEQQFFDDGMCVEQATFYHHFTLGFYLQSLMLRKANHKPVSEKMLIMIEKALEVSMVLTKPDGTLPAIGDIDNARSLYFNAEHSWDFRGYLSLGAVLFNRPDFKAQSSGLSEELLWFCDESAVASFENLHSLCPKECSKALSVSGYYVMRDSWEKDAHYLCFDCGDMAAGLHEDAVPSAAHGHADALSFELSVFGQAILAEGGFHTYFGPLSWHRYFREEAAHNTIKIAEHRQAEYCGRLTWKSVINPKLLHWGQLGRLESVCGEINYDRKTAHRREIVSVGTQFWTLCDQLKSEGSGEKATAYFHFDAGVSLEIDREKKQVCASRGEVGLLIQYFEDCELSAQRGKEGLGPEYGWQAKGYGHKTPAWVLSFEMSLSRNPFLFPMLLIPCKGNKCSFSLGQSEEAPTHAESVFRPSFSLEGKNYVVSFCCDTRTVIRCEGEDLSK